MGVISVSEYSVKFSDQFLFDTNVWLLLFGTIANYQYNDQRQYSSLLGQIIQRNAPVFITSMVLSEFCNVLLRHDFKQWSINSELTNAEFKRDFTNTHEYNNSIVTIKHLVNNILAIPSITKVSDSFHSINSNLVLDNFGRVDFNDSYIAQLAITNNYKVVTNDRDFQHLQGFDIITTRL